jgi:hypothetical protein
MTNYGRDISDFKNDLPSCVSLLSPYLNQGALSLMLGAGASSGFGLPSWYNLVKSCSEEVNPSFSFPSKCTNEELKSIMEDVKRKNSSTYIELIGRKLYDGVNFDFKLASKDLLIAITSLIIGRSRGHVRNVLSYNFDDILEWYLKFNGLKFKVTTFEQLLFSNQDIEVLHLHGYIPHDEKFGFPSNEVVFSKKEFEDRKVGDSYWKDLMYDFFRRNMFLAVGLSPGSLLDDICPYLRYLNKWYKKENLNRGHPYGVAFLTPGKESDDSLELLIEDGIIPCIIEIPNIPDAIFKIAQEALELLQPK